MLNTVAIKDYTNNVHYV